MIKSPWNMHKELFLISPLEQMQVLRYLYFNILNQKASGLFIDQ